MPASGFHSQGHSQSTLYQKPEGVFLSGGHGVLDPDRQGLPLCKKLNFTNSCLCELALGDLMKNV